MVSLSSYYGNSPTSENNAKYVKFNGITLYFSYETLVAVEANGKTVVIKNYWGPTTGKHLNAIDGGSKEAKEARFDNDDFNNLIDSLKITAVFPSF